MRYRPSESQKAKIDEQTEKKRGQYEKISFDDGFSFRITADTNKEPHILHRFYDTAHKLGCRLTQTSEDDTVYVTLRVKGGDAR